MALWLGTWKLNVAKSIYTPGPPPYKRATRRIVPASDGRVTIIDDLVRTRGGIVHLEWTGRFDGRDYPVQGVEAALTSAYRCTSDRSCEVVQKVDGEIVATSRLRLSDDGRTLTAVATAAAGTFTTVYEKQ